MEGTATFNRGHVSLLFLALLVFAAWSSTPPEQQVEAGLPQGTLRMGERLTLDVELALTAPAQAKGLMNVDHVPNDYGMVFLWSTPGVHAFHMKNTLIPLDIAWWDEDGKIVDIQTMTPCTADPCPTYTPPAEHIAAVEVTAGLLRSEGIRVGDTVTLICANHSEPVVSCSIAETR